MKKSSDTSARPLPLKLPKLNVVEVTRKALGTSEDGGIGKNGASPLDEKVR